MKNIVGLDWDNITLDAALERQKVIEEKEKITTLLYQTERGFHLLLLFKHDIPISENFAIRERYWDDKKRLDISRRRYAIAGIGHDILFNCKNNKWRWLIG